MLVKPFIGKRKVPFIHADIDVLHDGTLLDNDARELSVGDFKKITGIDLDDTLTLVVVAHQFFNWAPVYWNKIKVVTKVNGYKGPEALLATLPEPVESLEYPGFYLIPHFSNYLISRDGVVLKKSHGRIMKASRGTNGYYTFRLTDDSGKTANHGRHRILCLAFKTYDSTVEDLDVNHLNGIPGDDWLDNLEWATRSINNLHAVDNGLKSDNVEVEARDVHTGKVFIFASLSQAGRFFNVTQTTITNRCKTQGSKSFSGFQFRYFPSQEKWPEIDNSDGRYKVVLTDGTERFCDSVEAARLAGVTRTSLMRMLREGRNESQAGVKVFKRDNV